MSDFLTAEAARTEDAEEHRAGQGSLSGWRQRLIEAEGVTFSTGVDQLLERAGVVGTPGSGFGPSGEHFFRLTAFGTIENTIRAIDRIREKM